jgi:hypothetical protein
MLFRYLLPLALVVAAAFASVSIPWNGKTLYGHLLDSGSGEQMLEAFQAWLPKWGTHNNDESPSTVQDEAKKAPAGPGPTRPGHAKSKPQIDSVGRAQPAVQTDARAAARVERLKAAAELARARPQTHAAPPREQREEHINSKQKKALDELLTSRISAP